MTDVLRPMFEISVIIPGILLAYLPAKTFLKQQPRSLLTWLAPLLTGLCLISGIICYTLKISTGILMLITVVLSVIIYIRTLYVSYWKSVSVALAVCAVFACVNSLSRAINALITTEFSLWFTTSGGLVYNLICWIFVLLAWYPATHAAKALVEDENMAETWYEFKNRAVKAPYQNRRISSL